MNIYALPLNQEERHCAADLRLNKATVETWNIEPLLPEDNAEILQYMSCYWKRLGYQKENGDIDYLKLGEVVHGDLKNRFHKDCLHIVAYIIDNCKNSINAETHGLKVVKMWNCLNIFAENLI